VRGARGVSTRGTTVVCAGNVLDWVFTALSGEESGMVPSSLCGARFSEDDSGRAVTSTRNSVCNRGAAILGGHARIRAGILDSRCAVAALLAVTNVPKSAFARLNPINNLEVGFWREHRTWVCCVGVQAVLNSPGAYTVNLRNGTGNSVTAGTVSVVS